MNTEKYKSVKECTSIEDVNMRLSSYSHDLLEIRKTKIVKEGGAYVEEAIYILGERYQDEDRFMT